jgi:hypothetical protein
MKTCCKIPTVHDRDMAKRIAKTFEDQNLDIYMFHCVSTTCRSISKSCSHGSTFFLQKIAEAIIKELKLTKGDGFDEEAVTKYLDSKSHEPHWVDTVKAIDKHCMNEVTTMKDQIIQEFAKTPFNVTLDQCNPIFAYMTICLAIESFKVSYRLEV